MDLLGITQKNYKQERLKCKLPVVVQLLHCAQEELEVKRRIVDRMEHKDKVYTDNMITLYNNMDKLTNSISLEFSMLNSIIGQQVQYRYPTSPPPQAQPVYPFQTFALHTSSTSTSYSSHSSPYTDQDSMIDHEYNSWSTYKIMASYHDSIIITMLNNETQYYYVINKDYLHACRNVL